MRFPACIFSAISLIYHSFLLDYKGNNYKLCLLQYQFDGEEHSIEETFHGNSKNSAPYTRTKASVKLAIKKEASNTKPSELFDKLQGDVIDVTSCGSVPRNRQQIANAKKSLNVKDNEKDTLFAVMEKCKRE